MELMDQLTAANRIISSSADDYSNHASDPDTVAWVAIGSRFSLTLANSVGDSDTTDFVRFSVPAGQRLTAFSLTYYSSNDNIAFVALQEGISVETENPSLLRGYTHFGPFTLGASVGSNLISKLGGPFEAGDYSVWIQQLGAATGYSFQLQTDSVSPPSDNTAPAVKTFYPADAATGVLVEATIAITFDEPVQKGTGEIKILRGSETGAGTVVETFDVATSSRVVISGATLSIDPTNQLSGGSQYLIVVPIGAIKDLANNSYGGTNDYGFTTAGQPDVPVISLGKAYHWKSHAILDGVKADAGGGVLTASKPVVSEELGGEISAADVLAALKIAGGRNPNPDPDGPGPQSAPDVSPYQFIAADVVGSDGSVNSQDGVAILQFAGRAPEVFQPAWVFVEESRNFWDETANGGAGAFSLTRKNAQWDQSIRGTSASSDQEINLVGILKGDVDGSWEPPPGSQDLDVIAPNYFQTLSSLLGVPVDQWHA